MMGGREGMGGGGGGLSPWSNGKAAVSRAGGPEDTPQ